MKPLLISYIFFFTLLQTQSSAVLLNFDGIHATPSPVADYYESTYGVTFESNVGAYNHTDHEFSNEPSSQTIIFSLTSPFYMYKPSGFSDALSFFYSAKNSSPIVIYDAEGTVLASVTLPPTPGVPNAWEHIVIPFEGVATRVQFAYITLYDNIQLGAVAVPLFVDAASFLLVLMLFWLSLHYIHKPRPL